jgi:hypothetical protein
MPELYGKCGCKCSKCAAYIGNIKSDEDKKNCSEGWKKYLNISLKPDYCVCFGCQASDPWKTGNVIPDRSCFVRKCVEKSGVKTCANCGSFPCSFVEERSKNDYSRGWVEKRVGEKLTEETYENFVECFETYKHLNEIRKSISESEIVPQKEIKPLNIKIPKFPQEINATKEENESLKAAYDFLSELKLCSGHTSYINQIINEKRIKPALLILWVFAADGKFVDNEKTKLVIQSEEVQGKEEYNNIVRKKDINFHGSAGQVAILLKSYGLDLEIIQLPHKKWSLSLTKDNNNASGNILEGLKLYSERLVHKYGIPQYNGAWKLKGDAYKYFEKADFSRL